MTFSICIPNYNYEAYLGRAIQSVLDQTYQQFEVVVSDNASSDGSVAVVEAFGDPRIRVHVNACNVGFAGNLDRAGRMAGGDAMMMLSSDDLVRPDALEVYRAVFANAGTERIVISSTVDVIDAEDRVMGRIGPDFELWDAARREPGLEAAAGAPVYSMPGEALLRRCLQTMRNPFNFAATAYPRRLYEAVEGYSGGRIINPDKWFHWKLLGVADRAYFIDRPLFAYRWHARNQTAQQEKMGALKYLVDQYVSTLELDAALLRRLGITREDVVEAFVEYSIARHGLATLAAGSRHKARRTLRFGRAVYPVPTRRNWKARGLGVLLTLGPLGQWVARSLYARYRSENGTNESSAAPYAMRPEASLHPPTP